MCAFIERYCLVPEGALVGKPLKLDEFQIKFILDVYNNRASTSMGILSIARKNGKTVLIAGIALAHIAGPEAKQNSQIISGAMSKDQAGLVFKAMAKMIRLNPELAARCRIKDSAKEIIGLSRNVEYKALSAEDSTAHGLSPILAILDEVGQVKGPRSPFIEAITTSQGAHDGRAMVMVISTQAPSDADLLSIWIDDARKGLDKRIVCHVHEAPADCSLLDEDAWRAANPGLGVFRSLSDVKQQAEKAARMPSAEASFRNLILNQRVQAHNPFVSKAVWLLNSQEPDPRAFYETPVYCGLDLSTRTDLTAFVMVAWYENRWHVRAMFWTPEKGLADRANRDRSPYDVWVKSGHIRATPGAAVDYEQVLRDIADALDGCDVQAFAFDRWRIDIIKKEAERINLDLPWSEFGQGFKDMSPALDALEEDLLNDRMAHGMHPVLTMCAANAVIERDPADNRKLTKHKSNGRIDGMVALAMARGAAAKSVISDDAPQVFFLQ